LTGAADKPLDTPREALQMAVRFTGEFWDRNHSDPFGCRDLRVTNPGQ
jgi:hypothetical protein